MVHSKKTYDHRKIEKKWQGIWEKNKLYSPKITEPQTAENKFFNLWMFPYPSAEGVHVGTIFSSTGSDVFGRYMRMQGKEVFQPMGYDSFGIHSENFAIKIGEPPAKFTRRAIANYERQFKAIGHGYDWSRTVTTSNADYYKWTQWLFIQMFKAGLAYKKKASVNYCPSCKTVLSDEQIVTPAQAGKHPPEYSTVDEVPTGVRVCERCGHIPERRELSQWFFKITDYADRLLQNLDIITWSERVKVAQREWIGRKQGIIINYRILNSQLSIKCFTTRPDTNFGATFVVVSPEYARDNLMEILPKESKQKVSKYIEASLIKTEHQRKEEGDKKTGVFTGLYAVNQLNGYEMPIWVSDFVLAGFGTGAVVGVPGHDRRDFDFAKEFNLPVKIVVQKELEFFRSYLMGADGITDAELEEIGVSVSETTKSGSRKLEIPRASYEKYKKLIAAKMSPGFWNEAVGNEVWFLFKDKEGVVTEYILSEENRDEIAKKCSDFNKDPLEKTENIYCYLASNDWYTPYFIQEEEGKMINSEFLNGMDIHEATVKMMDYLEGKGWGKKETTYHLRDWLISRQRYWGPPIPMIYCSKCAKEGKSWFTSHSGDPRSGTIESSRDPIASLQDDMSGWYPVADLPVLLPDIDDYQPKGNGEGPLAAHPEFYETKCPSCGGKARRETDVSDTFLDSSWYFLRYPSVPPGHSGGSSNEPTESSRDPIASLQDDELRGQDDNQPWDQEITKNWLPVDLYFGGAEHSVLHLMYARFVTMALYDMGLVPFEEPFPNFFAHGLMIKDGAKMSKSRGNVVNPDEYIEKYGADTLRLYLMFMGPMDGYPDFRDTGIEGMSRFVKKLWGLFTKADESAVPGAVLRKLNQTIMKVTNDIKEYHYNTAIASMMEYINLLNKNSSYSREALEPLVKMIAPFAPHLAEEVWAEVFGNKGSIHISAWPQYDPALVKDEVVNIAVQINGKLRATLKLSAEEATKQELVEAKALSEESVAKWVKGKHKSIFVPGRIINFVV